MSDCAILLTMLTISLATQQDCSLTVFSMFYILCSLKKNILLLVIYKRNGYFSIIAITVTKLMFLDIKRITD